MQAKHLLQLAFHRLPLFQVHEYLDQGHSMKYVDVDDRVKYIIY